MAAKSEWRGLSRALHSGQSPHGSRRRSREPSWGDLVGWVCRHLPEILLLLAVLAGWRWLAGFVGGLLAAVPFLAAATGAVVWAPSRAVLVVAGGMWLTRHRLRAGLLEARVVTPSGRPPVQLGMWPIKVGERVWLWCPPGLSAEDLDDETDRLRAACVAREVRVTRDARWSAVVVVDVIRRDTLSPQRVIPAPITAHIPASNGSTVPAAASVDGHGQADLANQTGGEDRMHTTNGTPVPDRPRAGGTPRAGRSWAGPTTSGPRLRLVPNHPAGEAGEADRGQPEEVTASG